MAEPANSYMPSVPLNMSSSNEHGQEVRPMTSNIGMHILPVGSNTENGVALNTNCLDREALSGSHSIDLHSMERTRIVSSGVARSVTGAQIGLLSAQSTVMPIDPLMPSNESYSPSWPYVGQVVPSLNQPSLPGTQMGHSGPSTNQNSSNSLVIPDLLRSMRRMQQTGVNNNTTVNIPQSQPRVTPSSSEFSIIYEGDLFVRTDSQPRLITKVEGFRRDGGSEVFSFNWPKELQIFHYFPYNHSSFRNCTEIADFVVFRAMRRNSFLRRMQEESFCAVIELTWDKMFLIVIDEVRLVGVICPTDHIHRLERLLRGELQEHPNNQQREMSRLLHQVSRLFQLQLRPPNVSGLGYSGQPNDGLYSLTYQQQLAQSQLLHIREILIRQRLHESFEQERLRQEFVNQLSQQPLFASLQWKQRVQQHLPGRSIQQQRSQALRNHPQQQERQHRLPEELQQQGLQQQQLTGRSLQQPHDQARHNHPQQKKRQQRLPEELQQKGQQQEQLHQKRPIISAAQPLVMSKFEWFRRVKLKRVPEELQQQGQQQEQLHQERPIISAAQPSVISEFEWLRRVKHFQGDD